jgi:predicted protein tyrosine phosphatase
MTMPTFPDRAAGPDVAWIEPGFAIGSCPYAAERQLIRKQGICVAVIVHEPDEREAEAWRGLDVEVVAVPTPDWVGIPAAHFERVVEAVSSCLDAGRPVLLHCMAGINRAPTYAAAVLCRRRGLTVEAAVATIRRVRPAAAPTPEQEASLRAWLRLAKAAWERDEQPPSPLPPGEG